MGVITAERIQRELARRWPDKVLPFGAHAGLAEKLGVDRCRVRRVADQLGYRIGSPYEIPSWDEFRLAAITEALRAHGLASSTNQAARLLNCDPARVKKSVKRVRESGRPNFFFVGKG